MQIELGCSSDDIKIRTTFWIARRILKHKNGKQKSERVRCKDREVGSKIVRVM